MNTQRTATARRTLSAATLAVLTMLTTLFTANLAQAGAGWGDTTNTGADASVSATTTDPLNPNMRKIRTYYANSPMGMQLDPLTGKFNRNTGTALRKFVDPLPGLGVSTAAGGIAIPIAAADTSTYADADYYEIAVVEYTQRMHSDLAKATTLRGYVQIDPVATDALALLAGATVSGNGGVSPAGSGAIPLYQLDGVTPVLISRPSTGAKAVNGFEQVQAVAVAAPVYLGPVIIAAHGHATRIKFYNGLPNGRSYTDSAGVFHRQGDLFIPVDHTLFGGGDGPVQIGVKDLPCGDILTGPNNAPVTTKSACLATPVGKVNPDGTTTPRGYVNVPKFAQYTENREELHLHGGDNPWISDGTPHQWIVPALDELGTAGPGGDILDLSMRRGDSTVNVPDMPAPGPGAATYFWPNGQSGRLLFYHDHATGLTRLNVYAGTAAGYLLTDDYERGLNSFAPGGEIPLVIQDKTFVPADIVNNTNPSAPVGEDVKWDTLHWGQPGDLWFPHVYETNQDPLSLDGTNPVGRWDGASFFWPVFPQTYMTPTGVYGDVSTTPEAFMDTPIVNGMAYPTLTVAPTAYRFRILSVPNDRMTNLSFFVADSTVTGTPVLNTEVRMVPFSSPNGPTATTYKCPADTAVPPSPAGTVLATPIVNARGTITKWGWTESGPSTKLNAAGNPVTLYNDSFPCTGGLTGTGWGPADNRPGGVPDPATMGPDIIRIGNEGGLFQQAVVIPATPINYELNKRSVTVLNVLERGLWLGPAERADVIVDFSNYANKTLILYNDSGAPVPAGDPRMDYFTGDGDQTGAGGAPETVPGYGPNTRTIMQFVVSPAGGPATPVDLAAIDGSLLTAYMATQPLPVVPTSDYAPILGASANAPLEHIFTGAIYLNSYTPIVFNAADVFNYTPAPVCSTTASCITELAKIKSTPSTSPSVPVGNTQSVVGQQVSAYVESKAIQELFETDYGRMNATLGVELPFTSVNIQTTIPLAYVDPATETIANGETQFWKITHNGVDSHPVHFHFINVQVINRVGWDGTIKPIPADEVGWKETVKMHPLEDIIVAVRAKTAPPTPFGMPHSYRRPAPNQLDTDNHGITQIDPITGNAPLAPYTNAPVDYGSEYVWHCHILGHEENDFMRPFVFNAKEVYAPGFSLNPLSAGTTGINVTWADPTPIPAPIDMTAYDLITNPTGFLGNPNNEIGFRVERASIDVNNVVGAYAPVGTGLHTINAITGAMNAAANATSYVDPVLMNGSALLAPLAPANVSTLQSPTSVTLTLQPLTLVAGAKSYSVYRDNVLIATDQVPGPFTDNGVTAGNSYTYTVVAVAGGAAQFSYRVVAVTAAGDTVSSNTRTISGTAPSDSPQSAPTTVLMVPSMLTGITVTKPAVDSLTLNWPVSAAAQKVTSYLVSTNGGAAVAAASPDLISGLTANTSYSFTVAAANASGTGAASAPVTGLTLPAAPTALTTGAVTASSVALSWTAPALSTGLTYTVQVVPAAGTVAFSGPTAVVVSGLGPNTAYVFTVVASNASGASAASNAASALTLPVAPTGLSATPASPTSVTLAWTPSLNGAGSYTVQYSADGGGSWTSLAPLGGIGMTVNGLLPSTTYLFQVVANNTAGSSPASGQASATTPATTVAPNAPVCCTASAATPTSAVINWVASTVGPAASYTIERATNATFTRGLQTVLNVVGTSMPFTGMSSNRAYFFRVLAVNSVGSSAYSATFRFQPPAAPAPPAAPTAAVSTISTSAPLITLTLPAPAAGVTYTVYQQSRTGGGAGWSAATIVASGVASTTWTSAALVPMQYRYYLVAVNAVGNSTNGATSNNVTAQQLANAALGLAATPVTTGITTGAGTRSVTLSWALGAANGSTVTAVQLLRNATGTQAAPTAGQTNGALAGGVTTNNLAATAVAATVNGLARNTTYYFQVQEVTVGGNNPGVVVSATTAP